MVTRRRRFSAIRILLATIQRDLLIHCRRPADILNPLMFFLMVVALFPLGIGAAPAVLTEIAAGVIWVAVLLSTLLSIDVMFKGDFDDGSIEQIVLGRHPLILVIFGKSIAQWLVSGLPMTIMSPVFGLMFHLNGEVILALVIALLLATPVMILLGSIGAALTLGLKNGGVLTAIVILPLYIPLLILGTSLVDNAIAGSEYTGQLLWLGALLAISTGFAPLAAVAGLKIAVKC